LIKKTNLAAKRCEFQVTLREKRERGDGEDREGEEKEMRKTEVNGREGKDEDLV